MTSLPFYPILFMHLNFNYIFTCYYNCIGHQLNTIQLRIQDFPLGGCQPHWRRGVDLRGGHFSAKMYAKTKQLGPVGRGRRGTLPGIRHCNSSCLEINLQKFVAKKGRKSRNLFVVDGFTNM